MEYKWWWMLCALALAAEGARAAAPAPAAPRAPPLWDDAEHELLVRSERGAKNRESCRYVRGEWSACDAATNSKSRTLTLKKGDAALCERTKHVQKKCKKPCRYEKSSWSECSAGGEMWRTDALKPNSDASCEPTRTLTKKCNKNKQLKTTKDKGRRNRQ